jgi:TM2 domain-containing membrane protein YozV
VVFLSIEFFRGRAERDRPRRARRWILAVALAAGLVFVGNAWTREFFWRRFGGSWTGLRHAAIRDPFLFFAHAVSLVASPNKGLIFYAPLAVVGLFGIRRILAGRPRTGIFVALTFGGLVAGFSLLKIWADETWGPRYLHAAVAPLLLCLAVPAGEHGKALRRLSAALAAVVGGAVSLLGVLFFYGGPYDAAKAAGQNTLEAIQGDVVWNPIRFALRVLPAALHPAGSHLWVASHYWWFVRPAGSAPEPVIDLARYAHFQSVLLAAGTPSGVRLALAACGVGGAGLIALAIRQTRKENRAGPLSSASSPRSR